MRTIYGFIQITRPVNLGIAFLSIFVGGAVTGTIQPLNQLILACFSGVFLMAGANTINDVFDLEIDRINKPDRPLPSGLLTLRQAALWAGFHFLAGIVLSLGVHSLEFGMALGFTTCLILYSYRLKNTVLWGNFTVALISAMAFVYGGAAVGRIYTALIVGVFAFLFHLAREIIKDLEDMEGDRAQGVITLPIRFGVQAAIRWTSGILMFLILLTFVPYFLNIFNLTYLIIVFFGVDCFLIYVLISIRHKSDPKHWGCLAKWMKADMLVGLLAVYLGS